MPSGSFSGLVKTTGFFMNFKLSNKISWREKFWVWPEKPHDHPPFLSPISTQDWTIFYPRNSFLFPFHFLFLFFFMLKILAANIVTSQVLIQSRKPFFLTAASFKMWNPKKVIFWSILSKPFGCPPLFFELNYKAVTINTYNRYSTTLFARGCVISLNI